MARLYKSGSKKERKDRIRWRGHEIVRIEAFSDAVFAFAVTLLIVSLEVPKTTEEMLHSMLGFIPFGICFILLFQIWYAQNIFFRRFGVHDIYNVVLNATLIFFVLMYVYPLKFLFSSWILQGNIMVKDPRDFVYIFYIYSGGFACIYFLFFLMYLHTLRIREELELTSVEIFETKTSMYQNLVMVFVGLLSVLIISFGPQNGGLAGFIYIIIGPVIGIIHWRRETIYRQVHGIVALEEPIVNEVPEDI